MQLAVEMELSYMRSDINRVLVVGWRLSFLLCLLLGIGVQTFAQNGLMNQENYQLHIKKASDKIKIDGILDESDWTAADKTSEFLRKWPDDTGKPKRQTEVRMTYDEHFIYIGFKAIDTNYYISPTLKRDQSFLMSDAVVISLDPVNQRTNGFLFAITPYNVQTEDLTSAGGNSDNMTFSWDNKWFSATSRHENYWIAEIAIPFKTLRYKEGKTRWGMNFLRNDVKNNEFSSWTKVPTNFPFFDFGFTGGLIWDAPPPHPGTNVSVIPYLSGSVEGDNENGTDIISKMQGGFDSKIALNSSLNLDLTVNPDFSQVEVDKQQTNLTRFNLFYPERRTFFLENDDLFSGYGIPPIRPFYSRTIGLDKNGNKVPILGGARLSGNLTKRTRIGIMDMQTRSTTDAAAQNYTAVSVHEQIATRASIKGYFLNRDAQEDSKHILKDPLDKYGRNAGLQYDVTDKTGKWSGWSAYHRSFKYNINTPQFYTHGGVAYTTKHWNVIGDFGRISDKYYADMGFISRINNYDAVLDTTFRKGFNEIYNNVSHTFIPSEKSKVSQIRLGMENFTILNLDGSLNESQHDLKLNISFKNTSNISITNSFNANHLLYYTSFTDQSPIPPGKYNTYYTGLTYNTDMRKAFYAMVDISGGQFYNGHALQYTFTANYRMQPYGTFTMMVQKTKLQFPTPYGSNELFLIAPRLEINFSNTLFWTTFLQYNNQANNFNINSRLQWRYKPMSDLFVVYSDNYFTDPFLKNKNRALVFKLNWWLNL